MVFFMTPHRGMTSRLFLTYSSLKAYWHGKVKVYKRARRAEERDERMILEIADSCDIQMLNDRYLRLCFQS